MHFMQGDQIILMAQIFEYDHAPNQIKTVDQGHDH